MQSDRLSLFRRTLLLDAAGSQAWVACYEGDRLLVQKSASSDDGASSLMQLLSGEAISKYLDADLVIVGGGPGSYTGLRVALALAGGLACAWQCPLLLVSTLAAYVQPGESCIACLDARAGGIYAQLFVEGMAVGRPRRVSHEQLSEGASLVIGYLVAEAGSSLNEAGSTHNWAWVSPDAPALNAKWDWQWQARVSDAQGLMRQALNGVGSIYYPPFQNVRLDYLKEDDQVATPRRVESTQQG